MRKSSFKILFLSKTNTSDAQHWQLAFTLIGHHPRILRHFFVNELVMNLCPDRDARIRPISFFRKAKGYLITLCFKKSFFLSTIRKFSRPRCLWTACKFQSFIDKVRTEFRALKLFLCLTKSTVHIFLSFEKFPKRISPVCVCYLGSCIAHRSNCYWKNCTCMFHRIIRWETIDQLWK